MILLVASVGAAAAASYGHFGWDTAPGESQTSLWSENSPFMSVGLGDSLIFPHTITISPYDFSYNVETRDDRLAKMFNFFQQEMEVRREVGRCKLTPA